MRQFMKRHITSTNILIWLLVIGIFGNILYIAYLAFYPFKGVVIMNRPVPVLNAPIKAGGAIEYEVSYCRYTSQPSHFTRTLQGPVLITLAEGSASAPQGCHVTKVTNTVVPSYALPGIYRLQVQVCVQLSPLQNKCTSFETKKFQVIQ